VAGKDPGDWILPRQQVFNSRDSGRGRWILAFRGHLLIGSLETGQVRRGRGQTTGGKSHTGEKAASVGTRWGRNRRLRRSLRIRRAVGHDQASSNRTVRTIRV